MELRRTLTAPSFFVLLFSLLDGEPVTTSPRLVRAVRTGPRTVREFAAGDWRFRLSPAFLLARISQLRGVQPYQMITMPDGVACHG
jgi:hypothetical protein